MPPPQRQPAVTVNGNTWNGSFGAQKYLPTNKNCGGFLL
ncbi:hypothetical protein PCH70_25220 [Pseudomonas cichorii JBC1]|nr:hypothetical protein PCH70_25220 [Pseudomonas cichorii JBC1]